jgi:hypothetical protein
MLEYSLLKCERKITAAVDVTLLHTVGISVSRWYVLCKPLIDARILLAGFFGGPEHGGNTDLRNIGKLWNNTAPHPVRQYAWNHFSSDAREFSGKFLKALSPYVRIIIMNWVGLDRLGLLYLGISGSSSCFHYRSSRLTVSFAPLVGDGIAVHRLITQ